MSNLPVDVIEQYLWVRKWTRPDKLRDDTKAVAMHWVGKAGQRARDVIEFFNTREGSYGSAHAVIDLDGTIFLTLPWDEVGYHVGSAQGYTQLAERLFGKKAVTTSSPNRNVMGIELCHINWEGELTPETMASAVWLAAKICRDYNLKPHKHVLTHQMIVGWKSCPKWFVDHPDAFEEFRWQVGEAM